MVSESARLNSLFEVLTSETRRSLLDQLTQTPTLTLSHDHDAFIALVHRHLPRLAEDDYVEYEVQDDHVEVERGEYFDEFDRFYHGFKRIRDKHQGWPIRPVAPESEPSL